MNFDWPEQKPDVPPYVHGWNNNYNLQLFDSYIKPNAECIIELGTWFGQSTLEFVKRAPNAIIYTIDHYRINPEWVKAMPEIKKRVNFIRDHFFVNLWEYKDRVFQILGDTSEELETLRGAGAMPDVIYIDGGHDYDSVTRDLEAAFLCYPYAQLIGDDYNLEGVAPAVRKFTQDLGRGLDIIGGRCWAII